MSSRGYPVARCRELDRIAIEDCGIPGILLMEHASLGAAASALSMLTEAGRNPSEAAVLIACGPGNNGGDGFAMARHLHNAGCRVTAWDLVAPEKRPAESDAGRNRLIWLRQGGTLEPAHAELPSFPDSPPDLIVDAIFGTGLARAPGGRHLELIERINDVASPTLAVDVPSGFDADAGQPLGTSVIASRTVTFGLPKQGFFAPGAPRFTGPVFCVPIGIPREHLPPDLEAFPPVPHRVEIS